MTQIMKRIAIVREKNPVTPRIPSLVALAGLIALALCLAAGSASAADEHSFVGVKKCKTCHKKEDIGNQYGVWEDGPHAKAYEALGSDEAKKLAAEAGVSDPQNDDKCLKCHVTAHGVDAARLPKKWEPALGVQCESCHGAGKDYRKKKVMIDVDLAKSKGLIKPTEKECTVCHNDESPSWDPAKYTLADGSKVGFDFEQAAEKIAHPVPEGYDPMADGEAD